MVAVDDEPDTWSNRARLTADLGAVLDNTGSFGHVRTPS